MEQEFADLKKQVQALQKELARVSGKPSELDHRVFAASEVV